MAHKALVISVRPESVPQGQLGQWNDISAQMDALTGDIITPEMVDGADMSAVVSGVPTVFARADLFSLSLDFVQRQKGASTNTTSLIKYYESLVDEWRGFIACIALRYAEIKVRRIRLAYSDGLGKDKTANIYEPKGAFGNMLFESSELWCEQHVADNAERVPFIDVIKYNGKVIGGTSPQSIFFTAPQYSLPSGQPFVDIKTHRFTDPLHSSLTSEQAGTLFSYVNHLITHINALAAVYNECKVKPDYTAATANLQNWSEEIKVYCDKKGFKLTTDSVPPVNCFMKPFSTLLNYSSKLYAEGGIIYETDQQDGLAQPFDPKNLLLPAGTEIARLPLGSALSKDPSQLKNLPLGVLKAVKRGETTYAYFALPLSEEGICVFGDNIDAMTGLNPNTAIKSTLTATFDPEAETDNLTVKLELVTNAGKKVPIEVKYTAHTPLRNRDLLIWPNFISPQWDKYYLYSELPHSVSTADCPFRATPFLGRINDQQFTTLTTDEGAPIFIGRDGQVNMPQCESTKDVNVELLIKADNAVSDNAYKYEIYESNLPFKGVRLTLNDHVCGFLTIRYDQSVGNGTDTPTLLPRKDFQPSEPKPASVGIDFGSTNTAVAYAVGNEDPKGFVFKNQTVSLFGENLSGNGEVAMEKELFFFQNEEIRSNAIRSLLTLHDPRRVVRVSGQIDSDVKGREVKGGFPCFEKNLPITGVNEEIIQLGLNSVGEVDLVHNMKWVKTEEVLTHKKAFLRSLLLHVYAELFANGHVVPTTLRWSYPSSMGQDLLAQYQQIWESLASLQPVTDRNGTKVELSVSKAPLRMTQLDGENPFDNPTNDASSFGGENPFGNSPFESGFGSNDAFGGADVFGQSAEVPASSADSFGSSAFGGGTNFGSAGDPFGKPTKKAPTVDLAPDNGPIHFNFRPADASSSMTEAQAVGFYIMHQPDLSTQYNTLTLCFDVGGSTTDISALCPMNGLDGLPQTAMIKQNSIRFAAQRVSAATKHCSTELESVLLSICTDYGLHIAGLNLGNKKFSADTAEYYFNQVINSLTADQLPTLYKRIHTGCPKLMAVNLYVTGLIMYYAGQLTRKIVTEVRRSDDGPDNHEQYLPQTYIVFAGKGSRIFEWLSSVDNESAIKYYQTLFINGIGGIQEIAKYLCNYAQIGIKPRRDDQVKYEVAKGLVYGSSQPLLVPDSNDAIEILGEENFRLKLANGTIVPLPFDNSITPQMMEQMGSYLLAPMATTPCKKFIDFAGIFYSATKQLLLRSLSDSGFKHGFTAMNIGQYITNLSDFRAAQERKRTAGGDFDYVAPIIIIEGMKFYDHFLMDCLK